MDAIDLFVIIAFAGAFLFIASPLRKRGERFNKAMLRFIRRCLGIGERPRN
jgi:hypothetical protein